MFSWTVKNKHKKINSKPMKNLYIYIYTYNIYIHIYIHIYTYIYVCVCVYIFNLYTNTYQKHLQFPINQERKVIVVMMRMDYITLSLWLHYIRIMLLALCVLVEHSVCHEPNTYIYIYIHILYIYIYIYIYIYYIYIIYIYIYIHM